MTASLRTDSLRAEEDRRVLVMMIDRPEVRNALDPATLHALADAIEEASSDPEVGAAVLTGAGDICFCAGMDLRSIRSDAEAVGPAVRRFQTAMSSYERLPIVAAIRGMAVGGGFEIMLRCDMVVTAGDATFALPEVKRGLVPGGGAIFLPSRMPVAPALEIGLIGDPFDAETARALGLVNRVCPSEQVVEEAVSLAARIAANPPATVRRIRHLMWATARQGSPASQALAESLPRTPELEREMEEGLDRFLSR